MTASSEQHLCEYCSQVNNLVLRSPDKSDESFGPAQIASYLKLPGSKRSEKEAYGQLTEPSTACYFGPSLATIIAQKLSCALCRAISGVIEGRREFHGTLKRRIGLRFVTKSGYTSDARNPWDYGDERLAGHQSPSSFRVERQYGVTGLGIDVETVPGSGVIPETASVGLRVYKPAGLLKLETDSEATHSILEQLDKACPGTEIESSISEKSIGLVKDWLAHCVENHSKSERHPCDRTVSGYRLDDSTDTSQLPTRLIAVNPHGAPRLVETKSIAGRYLALSYRWGTVTEDTWRLKKANLEQSLHQLPYTLLPSTIRDAIELTRCLDFEYLWIDSCCIIQDDDEDWTREAATMQAVYQNATMTIAILGDRDSHSGFLDQSRTAPAVEIPWLDEDGKKITTVFVSEDLPFLKAKNRLECMTGLEQELSESSWSTRAWTFQEQMLSRRTLYVGQQQLYFECRSGEHSEDNFDQNIKASSSKQLFMSTLDTDFTSALSSYLKNPERWGTSSWMSKIATWSHDTIMQAQRKYFKLDIAQKGINIDRLLYDYTSRSLTYQSDKLIAFDGLANAIATRSGQAFNVGLWTNKIAKSLFWWLADGPEKPASTLIAPTWSWASRNGRIKGYDTELVTNDDMQVERKHADFGAFDGALKEVQILDGNFLVADERGAKHVSLQLKALCLKTPCFTEPASQYALTWKQLQEDVRLWSSANTSWDPQYSHLLFAPAEYSPGSKSGLQKKTRGDKRHCPQCHCLFDDMDELRSLSHMERCLKNESVEDHPYDSSPKALIGAAYFDEPQKIPPSFEVVLLWVARSLNTYYSDSIWPDLYRMGAEAIALSDEYEARYGWTRLKRSDKEILGFQGLRVNMSMDDIGSGPAFVSKTNPRIYFCLLVEPTQIEGTYRRCGVALTYWINGAKGSGGLPLRPNCTEKNLTLV